ncbi:DUF4832 domain-containing protein [Zoogloea sp.]|uniref:DUF4832 domain-containing protein n=1 Tax=Zoogloea sp. TaxID=49181 RepID=UPI002625781E|nr:DUF4832 domain-containing protein [Zoogloea sp.]MDD3352163.1 DUF4832 domain-containing protein [Zoogloea sp.]
MPCPRPPSSPLLRRTLPLLAVLLSACGGGGGSTSELPPLDLSVSFVGTNQDFPNPERGMTRSLDSLITISDARLGALSAAGVRLAYAPLRLDAWRNASLPDSLLSDLGDAFARVRKAGLKLVLRVSYNDPSVAGSDSRDATLPRIREHIARLAPVLAANADVIAYWQAGFIGAWGEWHTSTNGLDDPSARLAVRDALIAALPAGRTLQFRQPADLQRWYPSPAGTNTTGVQARIGLHNDCFLADDTDVGTYPDGESQRNYIRSLSATTPFGGETCEPPSPARARSNCADILREGAEYHVSYLGEEYYTPTFHDNWAAQGCLNTVRTRLGYRFELISFAHTGSIAAGQPMGLRLEVANRGWARLHNARPVQLLLRHETSGQVTRLPLADVDPRQWTPGQTIRITRRITLPAGLPAGDHALLLAFPDEDPRLSGDIRYAIRPANADQADQAWDAGLAAFALGSKVTLR